MSPTLPPFDYNLNSHAHGGTWGSREDSCTRRCLPPLRAGHRDEAGEWDVNASETRDMHMSLTVALCPR